MRRSEQTGQMRIAQRVECSGEEHTVTLDAHGCLHTTCRGPGCTKALERARFLLASGGPVQLYASWPRAWSGALDRAVNKRRARAAARKAEPEGGVRERLSRRAAAELNEALGRVGQRAGKAAVGHTAHVGPEHVPTVHAVAKFTGAFSDVARTRQPQSTLCATTGAVAWLRLTRHMPGGLFLERTAQRVAVAILDAHPQVTGARPGDLVVAAGKPGGGTSVTTAPVLVRRRRDGTWARVRWLRWQELSNEAVECYGRFGLCHKKASTTALAATYGRAQWASAREALVQPHREDVATALGNVAMLRAKLQGFVHTIDELRMLRDQADTAIVSYSTTDMGEVAGCSSECTGCTQCEGCPAHAERATRHEAVIEYERTRKQLALAEHNAEGIRRRAIEAGCAPEELPNA